MSDARLDPVGDARYTGAILAGGRSRRMGGGIKALVDLAEKPLLQHVIDRVEPQVSRLYLSVETPLLEFERFGLEQVPDPQPGSNGPLGGLFAALQRAVADGSNGLLLTPCDAPFLPLDLADRLDARVREEGVDIAVVRHSSRLQPTFSLWLRPALEDVGNAVLKEGMAGFMQFLAKRRHAVLDWKSAGENPFFNVNDAEGLDEAAAKIASSRCRQKEEQNHDPR